MKSIHTLLYILFSFSVLGQSGFDVNKLSSRGKTYLAKIEKFDAVYLGIGGLLIADTTYEDPLTRLEKTLSQDELIALTEHENPIVRCYAFYALTTAFEPAAFAVLNHHLQDSVKVMSFHSCLGFKESVSDYFIQVYRHHSRQPDATHLTMLDSILIFTPNRLQSTNEAIIRTGKNLKHYNRIKELIVTKSSGAALIALSYFQREEDIDIILNSRPIDTHFKRFHPYLTFLAIRNFPHPKFLPYLERQLDTLINKPLSAGAPALYTAIARYNNAKAVALLSRPFHIQSKALRSEHLRTLRGTLYADTHPIYNDLRRRLKETESK